MNSFDTVVYLGLSLPSSPVSRQGCCAARSPSSPIWSRCRSRCRPCRWSRRSSTASSPRRFRRTRCCSSEFPDRGHGAGKAGPHGAGRRHRTEPGSATASAARRLARSASAWSRSRSSSFSISWCRWRSPAGIPERIATAAAVLGRRAEGLQVAAAGRHRHHRPAEERAAHLAGNASPPDMHFCRARSLIRAARLAIVLPIDI